MIQPLTGVRIVDAKVTTDATSVHARDRFSVVVVGAGQAGLSAGFHLARRGIDFTILEASSRIGETWRRRWESLRLFTPARLDGLPGMPFPGRPDALPDKDQMAAYLDRYAEHFNLPIRFNAAVRELKRTGQTFELKTDHGVVEADQVVIATGAHPVPRVPDFAGELDPSILQLHSSEYRQPVQLRPGGVLVVGAGNSGAEVAMDASNDHRVWLSGRCPGMNSAAIFSPPFWWLGTHLLTIKTPIGRRHAASAKTKGTPRFRLGDRDFASAGISRVPRTTGVADGKPVLEDGRVLDIANVVWCTGFDHDLSWIDLPGFDHLPHHQRGVVSSQPGLYFVGLPFQYGFSSALIDGVGRDARYITERIFIRYRSATP